MEWVGTLVKIIIAAIIMAAIIVLIYGNLADIANTSGVAVKTKEQPSKIMKPPKKPSW